jgi:hypothetical protein
MNNRDIYLKDPSTHKLVNEGVANVNDDKEAVLRYELETFVCEGQYESALLHILDTYLNDLGQAQQPGVWISGFFGSGKSHFIKMLHALWMDTKFKDGTSARSVAHLPVGISEQLRELTVQGRRYGGLHAASGTLSSNANGSVRLALLSIVFKSVGLPADYGKAQFVMWLKKSGSYDDVRGHVEAGGCQWDEELDNFYVAEGLGAALVAEKPDVFPTLTECHKVLRMQYPRVTDVSNDDMVKAVRQALTTTEKMPLTLIALDEVQQYIGEDTQRSMDVQETVEQCCKGIGSQLLFVATGQTAVTGTNNLKKLEGRFTVRFELSDADVDTVVRNVVLAKKPEAEPVIRKTMEDNLGEISRHLAGTSIGHKTADEATFVADYPVLPTRRRFWEATLHALDKTGTDSQLRNQLNMVLKAAQLNLDKPVGTIVPADHLYFESASRQLQSRALPRDVYEATVTWKEKGTPDEVLTSRACGLVYLINSLTAANQDIGLRATINVLADLMVDDLTAGSTLLRSKLPGLLDNCPLLMKVEDEYHIQTTESAAWNDEFRNQRNALANSGSQIDALRDDRIKQKVTAVLAKLQVTQGHSAVARDVNLTFGSVLPDDANTRAYVWVRHGWSVREGSHKADAAQAGTVSPTVFVYIPKKSSDELYHQLLDYKAANLTLERKAMPTTTDGAQARAAIESIQSVAGRRIEQLLDDAVAGAQVYQGGGQDVTGIDLLQSVRAAANSALKRLYPKFDVADNAKWAQVYDKARDGGSDALSAIGYTNEPASEPVCKEVLAAIQGAAKGSDIRAQFEGSPYGWSRDTVDGALQVLLVAGLVHVQDEQGRVLAPTSLERKSIGKAIFKVEATTVPVGKRIEIRKLFQNLSITATAGDELGSVDAFLQRLKDLAADVGGAAPRPSMPDMSVVNDVSKMGGNERLLALYDNLKALEQNIQSWQKQVQLIKLRIPAWEQLKALMDRAAGVASLGGVQAQVAAVEANRLLLAMPDPVPQLLTSVEKELRGQFTKLQMEYISLFDVQLERLEHDSSWQALPAKKREVLLDQCQLKRPGMPDVGTGARLLAALISDPLSVWDDRIKALPSRFDQAREMAAKALLPEAQMVDIPRGTLQTEADVAAWIRDVEQRLKTAIGKGPIVLR